jgi:hypothetical protein
MDEKELKEIFEMLEQQGWKPMLCDTLFAPATELREQMNDATVEAVRPFNGTEDAPVTGGTTPSGGGDNTGGSTGGNTGDNTGGNNGGGGGTLVDDPDGD